MVRGYLQRLGCIADRGKKAMESRRHVSKSADSLAPVAHLENLEKVGAKFGSVRRVFRILDLVSRRDGLTAKLLARELGISLSTCYYLINILIEESYLERISPSGAYRLGCAVSTLHGRRSSKNLSSTVESVVEELAQRSQRYAYLAVLSDGSVTTSLVKAPSCKPLEAMVQGSHGASHALALGKVLIAGSGAESIEGYIESSGLRPFTSRTIVRPDHFRGHLEEVKIKGVATDVEEFEENLCCLAAPILGSGSTVEGAIGVSTTGHRFGKEAESLIELVQWAAAEATAMLLDPSSRSPSNG